MRYVVRIIDRPPIILDSRRNANGSATASGDTYDTDAIVVMDENSARKVNVYSNFQLWIFVIKSLYGAGREKKTYYSWKQSKKRVDQLSTATANAEWPKAQISACTHCVAHICAQAFPSYRCSPEPYEARLKGNYRRITIRLDIIDGVLWCVWKSINELTKVWGELITLAFMGIVI